MRRRLKAAREEFVDEFKAMMPSLGFKGILAVSAIAWFSISLMLAAFGYASLGACLLYAVQMTVVTTVICGIFYPGAIAFFASIGAFLVPLGSE